MSNYFSLFCCCSFSVIQFLGSFVFCKPMHCANIRIVNWQFSTSKKFWYNFSNQHTGNFCCRSTPAHHIHVSIYKPLFFIWQSKTKYKIEQSLVILQNCEEKNKIIYLRLAREKVSKICPALDGARRRSSDTECRR